MNKKMKKPDYVSCVRKHPDRSITWCGRNTNEIEWLFVDAEHAIKTAYTKGRQLICTECAEELVYWIERGTEATQK